MFIYITMINKNREKTKHQGAPGMYLGHPGTKSGCVFVILGYVIWGGTPVDKPGYIGHTRVCISVTRVPNLGILAYAGMYLGNPGTKPGDTGNTRVCIWGTRVPNLGILVIIWCISGVPGYQIWGYWSYTGMYLGCPGTKPGYIGHTRVYIWGTRVPNPGILVIFGYAPG